MYQDMDVSDSGSCIDQSACAYQFSGQVQTIENDSARVAIEFFATDNTLLTTSDSGFFESVGSWTLRPCPQSC
jgi:hypothetical protein